MTDSAPPPITNATVEPLAVSAQQLARMLDLSVRTIRSMDAAGKLPKPVRLNGRAVRWVVAELQSWLAAQSPDRTVWESLKRTGKPER